MTIPVRIRDGVDELRVVVELAQSQDLAEPHDDVDLLEEGELLDLVDGGGREVALAHLRAQDLGYSVADKQDWRRKCKQLCQSLHI